MAMAVNFRWNKPTIAAPKTGAEKERIRENLGAVGDAIMGVKRSRDEQDEREYQRRRIAAQDARQAEIDKMNAEDRARRIAEEDRRKQGFEDLAASINGKKAERESLRAEKAKLEQEIAAIKAGLGG